MDINTLARRAAGQHGVIALEQLEKDGITYKRWRRMCRDGLILEVFPGVGRLAGAPDTSFATIKAATLAFSGTASHTSSAHVWGAPCVGTSPVHLVTPDRDHRAERHGVILHRPTDALNIDPVVRNWIPTTRPLRTLVDLGAVARDEVTPVLQHFIAAGTFRPGAVIQALADHRKPGRHGIRALEMAVCNLALGAKPPDSWLEEAMAELFTAYRLPPFEFHAIVLGYEVDFLVIGTKVIVETDGWSSHGLIREQFERDRERDALLREAGYIVQRFTWSQITKKPAWVAQRIEGTLRQWSPHVLG